MDYPQYTPNPRKNKHLSLTERVKIELLTNEGKTPYAISKILGRPINTVLNELRRGTVEQIKLNKRVMIYYADSGQASYERNRKACGRKYSLLEHHAFIKYVEDRIFEDNWSVDSAVGRAKGFSKKLCTKTIYNYIDLGLMKVRNIDLPLKLRRNTKLAKTRANRKILGDSIELRPDYIENREEFGHWEIDTVVGSKAKSDNALLTLVERQTRNVIVRKIPGKTTEAVMAEIEKLKDEFGSKFSQIFKTITADNGSEFADLYDLKRLDIGVFFTHPYSSFERGTNEKHNGLIRRFIPKGKRISNFCADAIACVEDWCNGLPRKILGYMTPAELFESQLDQIYAL